MNISFNYGKIDTEMDIHKKIYISLDCIKIDTDMNIHKKNK